MVVHRKLYDLTGHEGAEGTDEVFHLLQSEDDSPPGQNGDLNLTRSTDIRGFEFGRDKIGIGFAKEEDGFVYGHLIEPSLSGDPFVRIFWQESASASTATELIWHDLHIEGLTREVWDAHGGDGYAHYGEKSNSLFTLEKPQKLPLFTDPDAAKALEEQLGLTEADYAEIDTYDFG